MKQVARKHEKPSVKTIVVDLDGTLLRSDMLIESFLAAFGAKPLRALRAVGALRRGKAAFKSALAELSVIDPSCLPYDLDLLVWLRTASAEGSRLILASASHETYVRAIAEHLDIFDSWLASDGETNLAGTKKAQALSEYLKSEPFTYIGNSVTDLPIWQVAEERIAVGFSGRCRRRLSAFDRHAKLMKRPKSSLRTWLKLLRVHQFSKNALIFLPLLASHRFEPVDIARSMGAWVAFSLCAASVYIMNDLVDLEADRKHHTKRRRPLAAGTIPLLSAALAAPVLLLMSFAVALLVSWWFVAALTGYFILTTAYTVSLKRKMLVDAIALATLYTLRVIAGAAAIGVETSEWLLAFSMFMFMALALIKRYVELANRLDASLPNPSNRNYQIGDLDVVAALAAASGFNAVTVLALYISSDDVHKLYKHSNVLWLACPVLMYWIGRMLMLAHRRLIDEDPVVFALRDKNSVAAALLVLGFAVMATI